MTLQTSGEAFNPLKITESVHEKYLEFFQTSFAPNNLELKRKLGELKEKGLLWREPYISISHRFKKGRPFLNFIEIHGMNAILSEAFKSEYLYLHQEKSIANILSGNNTVVASGTGSGKTEVFFIPILNHCINNRNQGIKAIIIYPMNALANDQIDRLRNILYAVNGKLDKPITFGIYTGQTPEHSQSKEFEEMAAVPFTCPNCKREQLRARLQGGRSFLQCEQEPDIKVEFQLLTRAELRASPPDILITNYVQLQYLMLRKDDEKLFQNNKLRFLILDEIHAYGGARGIDVSLLVRRFRRRIVDNGGDPICVGTSATLSRDESPQRRKEEIGQFAQKLFGVRIKSDAVFEGEKEDLIRAEDSIMPTRLLQSIDIDTDKGMQEVCKIIDPNSTPTIPVDRVTVAKLLEKNKFFQELLAMLQEPNSIGEISKKMIEKQEFAHLFIHSDVNVTTAIWNYLKLGTRLPNPDIPNRFVPLIRVNVHNFFKSIELIFCCVNCHKLFSSQRDNCDECKSIVEELGVCRFCGKEFFIAYANRDEIMSYITHDEKDDCLKLIGKSSSPSRLQCSSHQLAADNTQQEIWETEEYVDEFPKVKKCLKCGSYSTGADVICKNQSVTGDIECGSSEFKELYLLAKTVDRKQERETKSPPHYCPFCQNSYGSFSALSKVRMSSNTAGVTLFDLVYAELPSEIRKMLIFTDNRQSASYFSGVLEMDHLSHTIRNLLYVIVKHESRKMSFRELREEALFRINEWYGGDMESFNVRQQDILNIIDEELTSVVGKQRSLENLGLLEMNYRGLGNANDFNLLLKKGLPQKLSTLNLENEDDIDIYRKYLISILNIIRNSGAFSTLTVRKYPDNIPVGFYLSKGSEGFTKPKNIELRNIAEGKPLKFTMNVFDVDKEDARKIIEFSFDMLRRNNLLISRDLQYGNNPPAKGYFVVNENYTYIDLPLEISKCDRCMKVFSNIPNEACISWRCAGQTHKTDPLSFGDQNAEYYYHKYANSVPIRMVTGEDTGALDQNKRREIEINFKEVDPERRKIDVIVATPTLELGVDIGDLHCIGLYRTPPNPASYFQRVGRAGRSTGMSLNNTFVFQNSIDNYYYRNPSEMIKGEVRPPFINLNNLLMIQRHANAIIIEVLFVHSKHHNGYPSLLSEFVKRNALEKMRNELTSRKTEIFSSIRAAFSDLDLLEFKDSEIDAMIKGFGESMTKSITKYEETLSRYRMRKEILENVHDDDYNVNKMKERSYLKIGDQIWKLEHEVTILNHLMDTGVLPRYAFPGLYVDLEDEFGRTTFPGRSKKIAITEYAPGMELYAMKKIYRSTGVDIKFTKPHEQTFYICTTCNKYISNEDFNICSVCSQGTDTQTIVGISPDIIYLRDTRKRINEPRDYQEANLEIFLSAETVVAKKQFDNIQLSKFGNINIVQIVSNIITSDDTSPTQIELCNLCGRAKDENNHIKHKEIGGREYCKGKFEPLAIYHEMPTNVISVKLSGDTLFGIPVNPVNNKVFLTTFKNAIINATQMIAQAEEGEIDGVVKKDEIILFDNVEGGVGYVDVLYDKFDEIIERAAEMVLEESSVFGEECVNGCPKCLWSYRRKRDIPNMDKQAILPFLSPAREYARLQMTRKDIMQDILVEKEANIHTIYSPSYRFDGLLELRNRLRSASKMIKLTSLYVTDDKISWPDEEEKSWVNILSSIKQNNPDISITITVREPHSISHKKSLRHLRHSGVEIRIYKNEKEQRFKTGIVHSKLIVIDPLDRTQRYAIHTSGNLSAEMEKNHETFEMSDSENWVMNTYREITKIEEESRLLTESDTIIAEGLEKITINPGDDIIPIKSIIGRQIGTVEKSISIMDPYLGKIDKLFEYLSMWLKKDVQIKIITARVDSKDVRKVKAQYEKDWCSIKVIRYFDRDKKVTGRETILHDRCIILDDKKVIIIGKGVNTILESKISKDNVNIVLLEIPSEVKISVEQFKEFWDFRSSHNETIKSFPKDEF